MFTISYLAHELRRRLGRTILTALGLALGVGLVIGIIGVSQGLDDAQNEVLAPLGSVGTDILVTRVIGATTAEGTDTADSSTTTTTIRGGFFGPRRGADEGGLNQEDTQALLEENSSVVTDLAKLGEPGEQFTHDFFLSSTLLSFPQEAVDEIAALDGVDAVAGGLVQLTTHQTGTVPEIVASIQTGGETFTQTVRPDPMTDAEREAFQQCLADKGVTIGGTPGNGGGPPQGGGGNPAFDDCLPSRFQELRATFTTPLQTLEQTVNPPSTDITTTSYTSAGIDPANPDLGLVTAAQLVDGRWIADDAGDEVLLNVAYANSTSLTIGSTLTINDTEHTVVGLVQPTLTGSTADVYFPLTTLQDLASKDGRITQVLVKADSASNVDAVAASIKELLPGSEVVTTKALADQVTGSLADAKGLADRLGGALAVIVLLAAFAIAALLTLSSIAKRVREIGTLRAIGWSKARVVRQLLGETVGISLIGGVLGVAVGAAIAAAVGALSPPLSATAVGVPGQAAAASGIFGQAASTAQTTDVALHVPLHPSTLLLGVAFALVGGVLAGLLGGWRAARLSPAVALRDLG